MKIKLGTIGTGFIVHYILDNVAVTEGIALEAVYSRSREKGAALAAKYGASKVYIDMNEFLSDSEMNFVYIASPNILHYEQTKQALLAGKNVICEKTFCTKASQARELTELAKHKGLFLIDATPTSFLPNFEIVKREVSNVGNIKLVHANFSQYSSRYDALLRGEMPNVFNPEYAGGSLMDINYYNLYTNVALFGKPQSIKYYPNLKDGIVDTSGILLMKYDDFISTSVGAKDSAGINFFQIEGEKGYLYVKGEASQMPEIHVTTKGKNETYNEQKDKKSWFYVVQNITKMILSKDYDLIYQKLDTMIDTIDLLELVRKEAGICFPGDES